MAQNESNSNNKPESNERLSKLGQEAAGRAAGEAVKKKLADKAAGAVAGGTTGVSGVASSVGKNAAEAAQNLQKGDVAEAGSAALRGGATAAAAFMGSPILGSVVSSVLNTRAGRSFTKFIVWIIIGVLFLVLSLAALAITSATASITAVLSGQSSRIACVDPNGGGIPVSDREKLNVATGVVNKAYELGLGREGAVIGVMTALAESDLRNDVSDILQSPDTPRPLKSIGIFQQMPFYWANEFWPAGTEEGSSAFNDSRYFYPAKDAILDVKYSSAKFYEKFETDPKLSNGKWRSMQPWDVAQRIQVSIFNDGSNYAARLGTARSTVATIIAQDPARYSEPVYQTPNLAAENAELAASGLVENPCGGSGVYVGWAGYTLPNDGSGLFTDGPVVYPNTEKAVQRAKKYVGNAHLACSDGMCYRLCDHLAGDIWGYEDYSGYKSAKTHWYTALQTGVANPGNRTPPIGALLFWDTGKSGHVATYVGDGMVVSNMNSGANGPNVYLVPASLFEEQWGAPYLGWADPIFRGGAPGSALEDK